MYVSELSCIGGLIAFALALPRVAIPPRVDVRQFYGYSFTGLLPPPAPKNASVDPSLLSQPALLSSTPSGTILISLSQTGTIIASIGKSSLRQSTALTGLPSVTLPGIIGTIRPIPTSFDPFPPNGSVLTIGSGSGTVPGTILPTPAPFGNYSFSLGQLALSTAFSGGAALGSVNAIDPTAVPKRNVTSSQPAATTGVSSGTAPLLLGQGSNTAPYGNGSLSQSGAAYYTGSAGYSFGFPRFNSSGSPSGISNATGAGRTSAYPTSSSNATLFNTSSAESIVTKSLDPAASITRGPYPFPSSFFALLGSRIVGTGTGIFQSSFTRGNFTRAPVPTGSGIIGTGTGISFVESNTAASNRSSSLDPTASGIYGTGTGTGTGIFKSTTSPPFPSISGIFPPRYSDPPYPYSFPYLPVPAGSGISVSGVSATGTPIIGTGTAIFVSQTAITGDPLATTTRSRSVTVNTDSTLSRTVIYPNLTSISLDPSASATISTSRNITSTIDPSLSNSAVTGNTTSTAGPTGTGIYPSGLLNISALTPTSSQDPNSLTAAPTTLATSTASFTFTPTTMIMPSEYYYHHQRRPHNHRQRKVYEYEDGTDEDAYEYSAPPSESDSPSSNSDPAAAAAGYAYE